MTKQPEPYRYIHAAGPLSAKTTYQLILTGTARATAKELEALVAQLKIDIEILRADKSVRAHVSP